MKRVLLLMMCCPLILAAQTNITISDFSAAPGVGEAPTTLTFNIKWTKLTSTVVWSDTVWVFVDYNNKGTMTRLPLDPNAATLTRHSATNCPNCGVDRARSTPDGVWVVGNARTSGTSAFSATVSLPTATATATATLAGACIYAINYPPVGQYTAASEIKFTGTPPFYLTYSGGGAATVSREVAKAPYTIPEEKTLASFTDASLAPGVTKCKTPAQQTLNASAAVYCEDAAGVTLSLSGTENGAVYRLYNGSTQVSTVTGNGSPLSFSAPYPQGTYTATVEASAQFCPATLTGQVTVTEVPLPRTPTITASAETVCQNATLVFGAQSLGNGATYSWTGSDGPNTGSSYTFNTETAGPKTATVYVLAPWGGTVCRSTTPAAKSAWVQALPEAPSIGVKAATGSTPAVFTASGSSGSYAWSIDNYEVISNSYTCPSATVACTASAKALVSIGGSKCFSLATSEAAEPACLTSMCGSKCLPSGYSCTSNNLLATVIDRNSNCPAGYTKFTTCTAEACQYNVYFVTYLGTTSGCDGYYNWDACTPDCNCADFKSGCCYGTDEPTGQTALCVQK